MDKDLFYNKAVKSIESQLFKKPETAISAIKKFSVMQAKQPNLSIKNLLSVAVQAKSLGVEIAELNTFGGWKKRDKRIATLNNADPLYIYVPVNLQDRTQGLTKLPIYDFSQTNAAQYGFMSKSDPSLFFGDDAEQNKYLHDEIINLLLNKDIKVEETVFNSFLDTENVIKIKGSIDLTDRIKNITEAISYYKSTSLDDINPKSNLYKEMLYLSEDEKKNIAELVKYSVLNKLNIDYTPELEVMSFYTNLQSKLDIISYAIKQTIQTMDLETLIKQELDKNKPSKKTFVDFRRLTDQEIEALKNRGKETILSSDPEPILFAIGANYSPSGNKIKILSINGEQTKTTEFFIDNGYWRFNRFGGTREAGDIITFVMLETGTEYADAIDICFNALGKTNPLQEAIEMVKYENMMKIKKRGISLPEDKTNQNLDQRIQKILEENKQRNIEAKNANLEIEKETKFNSRVLEVSNNVPFKFKKMMQERGIVKFPEELKFLKLEFKKQDGTTYVQEGVGILCGGLEHIQNINNIVKQHGICKVNEDWENPSIGGDIHFPEYTDKKGNKRKTVSAGLKEYTFVDNGGNESKKASTFESKNDYFAAAQQRDFKSEKVDVIIANGVGQADGINKKIKELRYTEIDHYGQFDIPAIAFASKTFKDYNNKLNSISYQAKEFDKDPNDLLRANPAKKLADRLVNYTTVNALLVDLVNKANEHSMGITNMEEQQKFLDELEKVIDREKISIHTQQTLDLG